jgi:hypothetical protein
MAKTLVRSIVAAVAFTAPAHADWQSTKWGMSQEQVRKNVDAKLSTDCSPGENGVCFVKGPYSSGTLNFAATFVFKDNHLIRITLVLKDTTSGLDLIDALKAKYGAPFDTKADATSHDLIWRNSGDRIDLSWITVGAHSMYLVEYEPISSSSAKGL